MIVNRFLIPTLYLEYRPVVLNPFNLGTLFLKVFARKRLICGYVISQSEGRCCLCNCELEENILAFLLRAPDFSLGTPSSTTAQTKPPFLRAKCAGSENCAVPVRRDRWAQVMHLKVESKVRIISNRLCVLVESFIFATEPLYFHRFWVLPFKKYSNSASHWIESNHFVLQKKAQSSQELESSRRLVCFWMHTRNLGSIQTIKTQLWSKEVGYCSRSLFWSSWKY